MRRPALIALAVLLSACAGSLAAPGHAILQLNPPGLTLEIHPDGEWAAVKREWRTPGAVAFYSVDEKRIHSSASQWRTSLAHEMSHALEHLETGALDRTLDADCQATRPPTDTYWCQNTERHARQFAREFHSRCGFTELGAFGIPGDATCPAPTPMHRRK